MYKRFSVGMFALVSVMIIGCGNDSTDVGHMKTHDRNISKNDFDVRAMTWEFEKTGGLKIHQDDDTLYMQYAHHNTQPNVQFFIDVDHNASTGNLKEGGAEYVVENGYLHEATDTNVWGWNEIGIVRSAVTANEMDAVAIPLTSLKNRTATMRVNAQSLGKDWMPVVFTPSPLGEKFSYPE